MTAKAATAANTIAQSARVKQGNEGLDALVVKAATVTTYAIGATDVVATSGTSNHYWDFM